MKRILMLGYGGVSYAFFFLTFLYAIGFIGNVIVPKSLDSGPAGPWQTALAIDLGLLALFAVQHSVMVRPGFKTLLTRVIPASVERSTYVLASSAALILLFWQWRPLGGTVWHVEHPVARALLLAGFAFGWTLVLVATFAINHFDLFDLRQTWRAFRGQPQSELRFATPSYCFSRSSPRFEAWLRDDPRLGPVVRRFAHEGGMPRSAKRVALAAMWTAILLSSGVLLGLHWAAALATVGLGMAGTLSILFGVRTAPEPSAAGRLPLA